MADAAPREYRYERKFLIEELGAAQVRGIVHRHPAMFRQAYPPRVVNNLYLDTEDMDNYHANLAGAQYRSKARIRWYGVFFGAIAKPVLEFKIKDGLMGTKESYPLPAFSLADGFSQGDLQALLRRAPLPEAVRLHLRTLNVVLGNSYRRWYYASCIQPCRVTVDCEMTYLRVGRLANHFLNRVWDDGHVIVEMKYEKPFEMTAERVARVFPFRITRNSKYVTGIEVTSP